MPTPQERIRIARAKLALQQIAPEEKPKTGLEKYGRGVGESLSRQTPNVAVSLPIAGAAVGGPLGALLGLAGMFALPHKPTPNPEDVLAQLGLAPQQSEFQSGNQGIGSPPPGFFERLAMAVSPTPMPSAQRANLLRSVGGQALDVATKPLELVSTAVPEIKKEGLTPKTLGMATGDVIGLLALSKALKAPEAAPEKFGGAIELEKRGAQVRTIQQKDVTLKFEEMYQDLEAERLSFETLPKIPTPPEILAERNGIIYNGVQETAKKVKGKVQKGTVHLFTDPATGSTFAIKNLDELPQALMENRKAFQPAEPVAPEQLKVEETAGRAIREEAAKPKQLLAPVEAIAKEQIKRRFSKEEMGFEKLPSERKLAEQTLQDGDIAPSEAQVNLKFTTEANPTKTFKQFSESLGNEIETTERWWRQVETRLNKIDYGKQLMRQLREIAPDNGLILGEIENILHKHAKKRTIFGKPAFSKLSLEEAQNAYLTLQGQAKPLTKAVEEIVPAMREVYDFLFKEARAAGFEISYLEAFQPRMIKRPILETIYNYAGQMRAWAQQILREQTNNPGAILQSDKQMAEIINSKTFGQLTVPEVVRQFIDNYKASGFGKTTGEALADMHTWASKEYKHPFGSFDYQRKAKFPIEWYEDDARVLFDRYTRRAAKRIAEARWVGLNGEKAQLLQSQIAERDNTLGHLADTAIKRLLWIEDLPYRSRAAKGFEEFNAWYQYGTKVVPSLLVYLQQPLQPFISFMNQTGYIKGFRALGRSIFDKEMRELVRQSGVAQTDVFEATTGLASNQKLANAVRTAGSGFGWLNVFNKRWAVAAYNDFIHDTYNVARNPHSVRQRWAQKWMSDLGIDPAQPLSPDDVLRNAARLATDSQLQSNLLREPAFLSQPGLRTLFTLKRFTIKQFIWQKDMLLNEARKGNVLPILRAGLASVGIGELYIWLKDKYKSALRGERVYREEDTMWKRLINDVAYSSVLGWVGQLAGATLTQGLEGGATQASYLLTPTLPLVPQNLLDFGETLGQADNTSEGLRIATRYILKTQLPLVNDFLGYRYLTDSDEVVLKRKYQFVKEVDRLTKLWFDKKNEAQVRRAVDIWNKHHPWQDRIIPPWRPEYEDENGNPFDDFTAHRLNQINSRVSQQLQIMRMMQQGVQNRK